MFIIFTKEEDPKVMILENGFELENQIYQNYQKGLHNPAPFDTISYYEYWSIIDTIVSEKKTIYISPDGVYSKINLETLTTPDGSYYILNKNTVYLNSLLELLEDPPDVSIINSNAFLFGDPDFSYEQTRPEGSTEKQPSISGFGQYSKRDFGDVYLADLPYTRKEIESVDSMLIHHNWSTKTFVGKNACEEYFKNMSSPNLLHIATHGYFTEELPFDESNTRLFLGMNWKCFRYVKGSSYGRIISLNFFLRGRRNYVPIAV